jgi:hypothetical protein
MPSRTTSLIVVPRSAATTFSRCRSSFVTRTAMRTSSAEASEGGATLELALFLVTLVVKASE